VNIRIVNNELNIFFLLFLFSKLRVRVSMKSHVIIEHSRRLWKKQCYYNVSDTC